jgi:biotin transporter BioY
MPSASLARFLMIAGIIIFLSGGLVYLFSRAGINLFRLPGDIRIQSENVTCLIPIVSSIVLSILLTIILNVILRFLNK